VFCSFGAAFAQNLRCLRACTLWRHDARCRLSGTRDAVCFSLVSFLLLVRFRATSFDIARDESWCRWQGENAAIAATEAEIGRQKIDRLFSQGLLTLASPTATPSGSSWTSLDKNEAPPRGKSPVVEEDSSNSSSLAGAYKLCRLLLPNLLPPYPSDQRREQRSSRSPNWMGMLVSTRECIVGCVESTSADAFV